MSCVDCPEFDAAHLAGTPATSRTVALRLLSCEPCTTKDGQSGPVLGRTCTGCNECNLDHKVRLKNSVCQFGWWNKEA